MNTSRILSVLTLSAAVAIMSGCSKQESTPASGGTAPAASTDTTKPAAPAAPAAAAPAAPAAQAPAAVSDAAASATSQVQTLIDKAKSLVDNSQYADASKLLSELSSMKLTPEQQKVVDDLKTLVQSKLGSASSAVNGLLGK